MWCKNCNIETNESICPICGTQTAEDIPTEVFWCDKCKTPIINEVNQIDKGICPCCGSKTKYLASDLRPVFPEERLLLEILLEVPAHTFLNSSVWAANSRYYIDGKSYPLSSKLFQNADTDSIIDKYEENKSGNSYEGFDDNICHFIDANKRRLNYLKDEAFSFVKQASKRFAEENIVISFSGGKILRLLLMLLQKH